MMMHSKTDSDDTISYHFSSPRSPKRSAYYYVKSPSWESPRPSNHSNGGATTAANHSRVSSASRISSSYSYNPVAAFGKKGYRKPNEKVVIDEEGGSTTTAAAHQSRSSSASRISSSYSYNPNAIFGRVWLDDRNMIDDEESGDADFCYHDLSWRNLFFIATICFLLIFTCFCFIIWGVSKRYKPQLSVKSLTVYNFQFAQGSDRTGVPTKMVTMNCSMTMTVYNPAPFFGIYVISNSVKLMYSELTVATGELKKYHQVQKSLRAMTVKLKGRNVPLYGAGPSLSTHLVDNGKIPMKLVFDVESRGYVIGMLVTTKHTQHVSCSIVIDSDNNNAIQFEENACSYI